jgi:hypothetical protein
MPIEYIPLRNSIYMEDLGNSLKIVIPNYTDFGCFLYILLFLVPAFVLYHLPLPYSMMDFDLLSSIEIIRYLVIFFLLLFVFGAYLLDVFNFSRIFRDLSDDEMLIVTDDALYLSRRLQNREATYPLSQIRNFCPVPNYEFDYWSFGKRRPFLYSRYYFKSKRSTGGSLQFLCDNVEIRFAGGANVHEARRILNAIQEKFPQYKAVISPTIGYTAWS